MSVPERANEIDHPEDWRIHEFAIRTLEMREKLTRQQWPPWLSVRGSWFDAQLLVDGVPYGPTICWPHALFIASWLSETR